MTNAATIEIPLTINEQLDRLPLNDSILITNTNRQVWANNVSVYNKKNPSKHLTIRRSKLTNELRVYRLI